jgi:lipopolysaccharide heptosyltransferase II
LTRIDQPKIEEASIKRILLVRPRRMGDIILTTPALRALRSAFPEAYLCYLVEKPYARLIEGNGLVDEVLAIKPDPGLVGLLTIIKKLRRKKFDVALDFHGGPRSALLVLASGSRWKIGYKTKYKAWVYDYLVPRSYASGPVHSVINHLNLVRILKPETGQEFSLKVPPSRPEEREKIEAFWKQAGLFSRKVLALHISAGNRFRDWGKENLVSFLEGLDSWSEVWPLLIGSKEDKAREKEILESLGRPVPSLVGQTSLGELIAVLEKADLFVGPDSGPMHLAAALNKPIVALFGPTLPAHFAPWKAKAIILERPMACRPCRQRFCPEKNFACLKTIKPEEVIAACQNLLSSESSEKNFPRKEKGNMN